MVDGDAGTLLKVVEDEVRTARRLIQDAEAVIRLDFAIGVIQRIRREALADAAQSPAEAAGWPIPIRWKRPRRGQEFEALLRRDGRVLLPDGQVLTPSAACRALVGYSQWNGWKEWRFQSDGSEDWGPIDELRVAGEFDDPVSSSLAEAGPLTHLSDPVLAELWENDDDAVYDDF
jgi:hypothetical protein